MVWLGEDSPLPPKGRRHRRSGHSLHEGAGSGKSEVAPSWLVSGDNQIEGGGLDRCTKETVGWKLETLSKCGREEGSGSEDLPQPLRQPTNDQ